MITWRNEKAPRRQVAVSKRRGQAQHRWLRRRRCGHHPATPPATIKKGNVPIYILPMDETLILQAREFRLRRLRGEMHNEDEPI